MAIEIREAFDAETLERIFRFRYAVHVEELGKGGDAIDHARRMMREPADDHATHFYAEEDGRMVGCARVNAGREAPLPGPYRAWLDMAPLEATLGEQRMTLTSRLMVDPSYRGRTLASLLVLRLYAHGLEIGTDADFIYCEPNLLRLYYRLGYRPYRAAIRPDGTALRVPLVLCLRDSAHLLKAESPFAMMLPQAKDDHGHTAQLLGKTYTGFDPSPPCLQGDLRTLWAQLADGLTRTAERRSLLDGLEEAQVDRVLGAAAALSFGRDEIIQHRDERRPGLGLVLSGRLGVGLPTHDGWHWLEILGPGDVFGEPDAPPAAGRATDLVALEDTRVALLSENLIARTTERDPTLAARLAINLVGVLRQRVDDLHRRSAAWILQERGRLTRQHTIPPISSMGSQGGFVGRDGV